MLLYMGDFMAALDKTICARTDGVYCRKDNKLKITISAPVRWWEENIERLQRGGLIAPLCVTMGDIEQYINKAKMLESQDRDEVIL